MKRLLAVSISALLGISLITGCSAKNNMNVPQVVTTASATDISNQYIVTARALIEIMPKTKVSDQFKVVKDFEREIKTLNRFALEGLLNHAYDVLLANLKPGQNPNESPVIKLVDSLTERLFGEVYKGYREGVFKVYYIAVEKNSQTREKLISEFSKSIKKLAKADLKLLVKLVKGENSNMGDFLDPNSPLALRLIKLLEERLK